MKLDNYVPFSVETEMKNKGGQYTCAGNWKEHVVVDGNLITGQNPASSAGIAKAILKMKWLVWKYYLY